MYMCLVCSMVVMNTQVPSSTLGGLYSHADHGCKDHVGLLRKIRELARQIWNGKPGFEASPWSVWLTLTLLGDSVCQCNKI